MKSSQQKKKDAQRAKAAVAAQLQRMAEAAVKTSSAAAPVILEERALGEVGARFEALVEQKAAGGRLAGDHAATDGDGEDTVRDAPEMRDALPSGPSRTQIRRTTRMTIDELKLKAPKPALVEFHDPHAPDPVFLVTLKCQSNSIPVPRHWIQKSLFLKNQIDREPSDDIVPTFIENTGVAAMRPDNGKADPGQLARPFIVGHPKLPLTQFGDVFYEGKDMRARFRRFRPGVLSERLRQALGMTMNSPPPWLYGMQRLARLPPAYPALKIPGLNAPLPPGCRWGRSRGEWGEPPRRDDNSLVFPGVLRDHDDVSATVEAAVGSVSGCWGSHEESVIVVQKKAPAKAAAPATPAAPAVPPTQTASTPSFVPTAAMMPQFSTAAAGATQTVFAQEYQRYNVGYQGGGYMPSQFVYSAQGAPPQPQYSPGYAPYPPGYAPPPGFAAPPPGFAPPQQPGAPVPPTAMPGFGTTSQPWANRTTAPSDPNRPLDKL